MLPKCFTSSVMMRFLIINSVIIAYINIVSIDAKVIHQTATVVVSQHTAAKSSVQYQLWLSENSLEMLLNETKHNLALLLAPPFSSSSNTTLGAVKNQKEKIDSSIQVKFSCQSTDGDEEFSWTSVDSNCTIIRLLNGYEYLFDKTGQQSINLTIQSVKAGKQVLIGHARFRSDASDSTTNQSLLDTHKAYVTINVGRARAILTISTIIGWIYFAAWSISFYPQIWENFTRRSVVGLNFDFVALNITGFLSYAAYNVALYFIPVVQDEFYHKNPLSQIPVEVQDVVFALHAVAATLVVMGQCFAYERGEQTVSWLTRIFLAIVWIGYIVLGFIVAFGSILSLLDLLTIFSTVKLILTIIKYVPQAWMNYRRKSTVGWSIANIFLDFTGGFLSMGQMFLLAYNYDDWDMFINNPTKFGLGLFSMLFDLFFMLQHYVLYPAGRYLDSSRLIGHSGSVNGGDVGSVSIIDHVNISDAKQKIDTAIISNLTTPINYGSVDVINTNNHQTYINSTDDRNNLKWSLNNDQTS